MAIKAQKVTRKLFAVVLDQGKKYHSTHLSFKICTTSEKIPIVSFVVSKKIAKQAVSRNFLKRRGRSIVKKLAYTNTKPFLGVFFFKKGSENLSFQELEEEIMLLLRKAGMV